MRTCDPLLLLEIDLQPLMLVALRRSPRSSLPLEPGPRRRPRAVLADDVAPLPHRRGRELSVGHHAGLQTQRSVAACKHTGLSREVFGSRAVGIKDGDDDASEKMRHSPLVLKVKRLFDKVPLRKEKRGVKGSQLHHFPTAKPQQEEIKMSHSVDVTLFASVDS